MAFITPRSAGPQRDLAYLDRYMGATGQLVNTRMGAADQQLNIGQMAQQDRQFGESRRDRALAGLAQSLQFANQLHMDQKRLSRQSQQMRQNAVFGGINAATGVANTAMGAAALPGQLALNDARAGLVGAQAGLAQAQTNTIGTLFPKTVQQNTVAGNDFRGNYAGY
jgi:hypothetical protein